MAHIEVTEEELTTGSFPPLCAKTGEPTSELVDFPLVVMPTWTRVLLVLGVVPWIVARPFVGRRIVARLPLTETLVRRTTKSRADLVAALFGGLLASVVGAFVPRDDLQVGLVAVGFLIVVGSVIALILGERDYGVDLRPTRWDTVILHRVHPRFRDALVRGDARLNERSVDEIVSEAQAAAHAADPWG